uniref:Uncharacterized protein n=1 Tax=Cacopsylla melanoneura TaxID=428564 RepID=A0A8D9BFM7_9HEMI
MFYMRLSFLLFNIKLHYQPFPFWRHIRFFLHTFRHTFFHPLHQLFQNELKHHLILYLFGYPIFSNPHFNTFTHKHFSNGYFNFNTFHHLSSVSHISHTNTFSIDTSNSTLTSFTTSLFLFCFRVFYLV